MKRQNKDGSWGSARNTWGGDVYALARDHAFRSAVTAMCVLALIEIGRSDPRNHEAIDRGETWLLEHLTKLRRATPDAIYNNWGHAYAIQALARLHRRHAGDKAKQARIKAELEHQLKLLERYECVDGGGATTTSTLTRSGLAARPSVS